MSISKLSATLQNQLIKNIKNNVDTIVQSGREAITKDARNFITVTDKNVIRLLSNKKQVGVFSAEAFKELGDGFGSIVSGKTPVSSRVIAKSEKLSGTFRRSKNLSKYPDLTEYLNRIFVDQETVIKRKYNKIPSKDRIPYSEFFQENASKQLLAVTRKLAIKSQEVFANPTGLYQDFLKYLRDRGINVDAETKETTGRSIATVAGLTHAELNTKFYEYLKLGKRLEPHLVDFISANVDAGHLLGIFTQKLAKYFGAELGSSIPEDALPGEFYFDLFTDSSAGLKNEEINQINSQFSKAFNLLENIDYLSSSITLYPDIFAKLTKEVHGNKAPSSAAEFQFYLANQEVGRLLTQAGTKLNDLVQEIYRSTINDESYKQLDFAKKVEAILQDIGRLGAVAKDLASKIPELEDKRLQAIVDKIVKNSQNFGEVLVNAEGSDNILTAIGKGIANTIALVGKPILNLQKSSVNKKVAAPKPKATTTSKARLRQPVIKKPGRSSNSTKTIKLRPVIGPTIAKTVLLDTSTINLQAILNASLIEQIKRNMGTGNRRDVLNLRSGRFAESVKVERLSESRAGMITAFYTYMKNPYATFSSGGRQELPRSRDPKLLISKSIRELVQQQVGNRLRAVLI